MQRPIILTTCTSNADSYLIHKAYLHAITQAGGDALIVGELTDDAVSEIMKRADGLLLSGGSDIHPNHYGEEVAEHNTGSIDADRDVLEKKLITSALLQQKPILAICRGLQVLNVHFGGTLYQDIPHEVPGALLHATDSALGRGYIAHDVTILPDTHLSTIIGERVIRTNSFHHQGIKTLASGLKKSAETTDGIIEGIEHPEYPFVVGVEWHPEELPDEPSGRLFRAFITTAQTRADHATDRR